MSAPAAQKKAFGKSTREVPHHTQKAQKWYPAEDEYKPKQVSPLSTMETEAAAFSYGGSVNLGCSNYANAFRPASTRQRLKTRCDLFSRDQMLMEQSRFASPFEPTLRDQA